MKGLAVLVAALACAASASAQYFSAGWQPGQPVPPPDDGARPAAPQRPPPPAPSNPARGGGIADMFDMNKLLTSGPAESLFTKMGVNITEKMEQAKKEAIIWDPRVPLITDANFQEVIVDEELTPEEEELRAWFLIITVSAGGKNAYSKIADGHFDAAYNLSMVEGDLPNIRWGRIDYLNVTYLTTKWSIWQAPYLVVATDRGRSLRFYKAQTVRLDPETIREFLHEEGWRETDPWTSVFAPGGDKEWLMHYFALALKAVYEKIVLVPRWVLMLASGGLANIAMRYAHRNDPVPEEKPAEERVAKKAAESEEEKEPEKKAVGEKGTAKAATPAPAASVSETTSTGASPSKGRGSRRKGAKK